MAHGPMGRRARGRVVFQVALFAAIPCATACRGAGTDPAGGAPEPLPAQALVPNAVPVAAPPATLEDAGPRPAESSLSPPAAPDATAVALSADDEEFRRQVDCLQREGRLAELRGSFGPGGALDARLWTYRGRLVKMQREGVFARPLTEIGFPDTGDVREIAVRYDDGWGERTVTNAAEIALWLEALVAGSVVREPVRDTRYYPGPDRVVGDSALSLGINGLWFSSHPSTLEIRVIGKPPLVLELFLEDPAWSGGPRPSPGSPVVEKVKSYRVQPPEGRALDFENPLLDPLVERYLLEITREKGLTHGEWTTPEVDGGGPDA